MSKSEYATNALAAFRWFEDRELFAGVWLRRYDELRDVADYVLELTESAKNEYREVVEKLIRRDEAARKADKAWDDAEDALDHAIPSGVLRSTKRKALESLVKDSDRPLRRKPPRIDDLDVFDAEIDPDEELDVRHAPSMITVAVGFGEHRAELGRHENETAKRTHGYRDSSEGEVVVEAIKNAPIRWQDGLNAVAEYLNGLGLKTVEGASFTDRNVDRPIIAFLIKLAEEYLFDM